MEGKKQLVEGGGFDGLLGVDNVYRQNSSSTDTECNKNIISISTGRLLKTVVIKVIMLMITPIVNYLYHVILVT